jgi:hypothetical protein
MAWRPSEDDEEKVPSPALQKRAGEGQIGYSAEIFARREASQT